MEMFFIAGISVGLLVEFLLISKKNKSGPDKILTVWMFVILLHLFLFFLYFTNNLFRFPFILGVEMPFPLLHGVFLFLYAGFATNQLPSNRSLLLLHFLPAAAMYGYLIIFFILPPDQKISVYANQGKGFELFMDVRKAAVAFSGIVYVSWTILLLKNHQKNIRDRFSDLDTVNLEWLRSLTIGMGIIWLLVVLSGNDTLIFIAIVLFIFFIGFFGVRQADIFAHNEPSPAEEELRRKYTKSGLTEEMSQKLHRSLRDLMNSEAPYRKSDLSIGDLSSKLGVHPNYLSQIINEQEVKNFYDFVNMYRVEEFKRLLAIPKNRHVTLLSLAFDCGFNSKSSFNRFFKKATGQTPSEYFSAITAENHPPA